MGKSIVKVLSEVKKRRKELEKTSSAYDIKYVLKPAVDFEDDDHGEGDKAHAGEDKGVAERVL